MNFSNYRVSLDIRDTGSQALLKFNQNDTARNIVFVLAEGGKPYKLTSDCSCKLSAVKPDGTKLLNDCTVDAENGTILYDVTAQTTSCVGTFDCQLTIMGKGGAVISAPIFSIQVKKVVFSSIDLSSSSEFGALVAMYNGFEDYAKKIQGLENNADNFSNVIESYNKGELKGEKGDPGDSSGGGGKETYDETFDDEVKLRTYLNRYSGTALAGKHILFTGEFSSDYGSPDLDFHGADLTVEHGYDFTAFYCFSPTYQNIKNIGILHGRKWTLERRNDEYSNFQISIDARVVDGLGYGVQAEITADFIRDAYVQRATSKTGTSYTRYGEIYGCIFGYGARVNNYAVVTDCTTAESSGSVMFTNCTVYKNLKDAQPISSDDSSPGAKWRTSASGATSANPVKFIRFDTSMENTTFCSDPPPTAEITVGVSQMDENGRASQMVIHECEPTYGGSTYTQIYHVVITYKTNSVGALTHCVIKYYNMRSGSVEGSATYSGGSWTQSYPWVYSSFRYYY